MLNPHYVTGLVESGGIFTYTKMGGNVYPYFGIKMHASDLPLLNRIQEFLGGIGAIYRATPKKSHAAAKAQGSVFFKVFRFDELTKLAWCFLEHPFEGEKAAVFKIWKDMVMLKTVNRKQDWPRLHELAAKLTKANGGKIKRPRRKNLSTNRRP